MRFGSHSGLIRYWRYGYQYLYSICNQWCPKWEIAPLIDDRSKACATSPAGYTIGEGEDMLDEALVDGNGVPTDG